MEMVPDLRDAIQRETIQATNHQTKQAVAASPSSKKLIECEVCARLDAQKMTILF
jgi:hypothetical protein